MTKSYSPTLATAKDRVRFSIADNDPTRFRLHDEEINAQLTATGSENQAAANCARTIYNLMSQAPDRSIGDISVQQARADGYLQTVLKLEADAQMCGATARLGGVSYSRADTLNSDSDFKGPRFGIGMDYVGSTDPEDCR